MVKWVLIDKQEVMDAVISGKEVLEVDFQFEKIHKADTLPIKRLLADIENENCAFIERLGE